MAQRFLSIKNFEKYQHYKKRNPTWIKLHLELLDDPDFLAMPDASKWHYIGLLLVASRHGNDIKPDFSYIKNRLGLTETVDLNVRFLKEHVLASSASRKLLAINSKFGDSETETETETETEIKKEIKKNCVPAKRVAGGETNPMWEAYSEAFTTRYGFTPLRGAAENGMLARLLKTIPREDAPEVARFYVRHDAGLCTLFGILKKNRTCWTPLKTWRRWRNTTDLDMGGLTWYKVRTI